MNANGQNLYPNIAVIAGHGARIDDLDKEIQARNVAPNSAPAALVNLKEYRNNLIPLLRLPNEVLGEIFLFLMYEHINHDTRQPVGRHLALQGRNDPHRPLGWIVVSHVCRRWRAAAVGYPRLWRVVVLTENEDRVTTFVKRSGSLPLSFKIWNLESLTAQGAEILFQRYAHRIKSIDGLTLTRGLKVRLVQAGIPESLPLEELAVTTWNHDFDVLPPLSTAKMPHLKTLRYISLLGTRATFALSLLRPTITTLEVERLRMSVDVWVQTLRALPRLIKLRLHDTFTPYTESDKPGTILSKLRLQRLESIDLCGVSDGTPCAALMERLAYPCTAGISFQALSLRTRSEDNEDLVPSLTALGRKIAGDNMIGDARPVTSMTISVESCSDARFSACMEAGDTTLHLLFREYPDHWWQSILENFPFSRLSQLTLNFDPYRPPRADTWSQILPKLSALVRLELRLSTGALEDFLVQLENNAKATSTSSRDPETGLPQGLFLPRLTKLVVHSGFSITEESPDKWELALRARAECGLHLNVLEIHLNELPPLPFEVDPYEALNDFAEDFRLVYRSYACA